MNATQEPTVKGLVDALASGQCDGATFLGSMRDPMGPDATGNWEVLSLLDQYYRRGKISKAVYQEVRIGLAQVVLGLSSEEAPSPRAQTRVAPRAPPPDSVVVTAPAAAGAAQPEARRNPAAAPAIKAGDVLRNRYRIIGILGHGGMGTVYEADDTYRLDIPPNGQGLAIKVLHPSVTTRAELFSELRREFQHLQSLSHPNIVRAFEFDRDGALAFFTMELLNGSLLSQVLLARNRVPLDTADAWAIVRDVGAAIAHAHSRNVVHGDINPQNIFITQRGNVRVLDFGASHALSKSTAGGEVDSASFATPGYVSCQVLEGERPDARDDVFALACMTYLLLSGEHPFKHHSAIEARTRGMKPKRLAQLRGQQWRALRAGLNWDRDKRPADVAAWLAALDLRAASARLPTLAQLTGDPQRPRRRIGLAVAITAALLGIVALGILLATQDDSVSARVAALLDRYASTRVAEPALEPAEVSPQPSPNASAPPRTAPPAAVAAPPAVNGANKPPAAEAPPSVTPGSSAQTTSARPAATHSGSQIELAADTVEVPPHEPSASVLVHRKGSLRTRAGFTWWTEAGTAKPATDYSPVSPHVEYFDEGKATVTLSIRVADAVHSQDKSFYVVIDQPGDGSILGARTLTMITLPGTQSGR